MRTVRAASQAKLKANTVRSGRERPNREDIMSDVETLLSRERMLRLREAHLKREAKRCHEEADELRRAAFQLRTTGR